MIRIPSRRLFLALICVVFSVSVVISGISVAGAANPDPLTEANTLTVHIWPGAEAGKIGVLVQAVIPDTVALPVRVRIPVPEGYTVNWAGEITPNVGEDLTRAYTTVDTDKGSYIEIVATESRTVQADYIGSALSVNNGKVSAQLSWEQSVPAQYVTFDVRVPANASMVKIDPAPADDPEKNPETGEWLYSLESKALAAGEAQPISIAYSTSAGSGFSLDFSNPITIVLLVLVVALVVAVLYVVSSFTKAKGDAS